MTSKGRTNVAAVLAAAAHVGTRDNDLFGVTALSPTNVWAVGNVNIGHFQFRPLVEHWNGARWSLVRAPTAGSAGLNRISMLTPSDGWAVGSRGTAPHSQALIERWNGRAWTVTPSPDRRPSSELLGIAGTQRQLWAVGDSATSTLILRH